MSRLRFAIVSQSDNHPTFDFIDVDKIRYLKVDHTDTYGVCWARSIAANMFGTYDYYLQIDGHMYPEQDWDETIIKKYHKAQQQFGDNVLLTAAPAPYQLIVDTDQRKVINDAHQYPDISGRQVGEWATVKRFDTEFQEVYYVQCAALFSEGRLLEDVPIDPEMNYFAEEITYSIRAFTSGYRMVAFDRPILYHLFGDERKKSGVYRNPWSDEILRLTIINDRNRDQNFFAGNIPGRYGVTKKQIGLYCLKSGFIAPNLFDA